MRPDAASPLIVMTIGGSDSGGGAGVQSDLKTLSAHRCHAVTVVTAVTAQNTRGVEAAQPMTAQMVRAQLRALLDDLPPQAVKTGFLGPADVIEEVAEHAPRLPNLVVDPVLADRAGRPLADLPALEAYRRRLLPAAALAAPNHREAALLTGRPVIDLAGQRWAARELADAAGVPVLVTGGRLGGPQPVDVFCDGRTTKELSGRWVRTRNRHGTGDALSASIAARLAAGTALATAIAEAKAWVSRAITGAARWRLGGGEGPIDPFGWG